VAKKESREDNLAKRMEAKMAGSKDSGQYGRPAAHQSRQQAGIKQHQTALLAHINKRSSPWEAATATTAMPSPTICIPTMTTTRRSSSSAPNAASSAPFR